MVGIKCLSPSGNGGRGLGGAASSSTGLFASGADLGSLAQHFKAGGS